MAAHFPVGPWSGPYCKPVGGWLLVLLDSTFPDRVDGDISSNQLEGLKRILDSDGSEHVLIALHHQPVLVGAPWIDRFPLKDPDPFWSIVDSDQCVRGVIWGHIHHDFDGQRGAVRLLGCVSTAANSHADSQRFDLDSRGPAYRQLELHPNGEISTEVVYSENGLRRSV